MKNWLIVSPIMAQQLLYLDSDPWYLLEADTLLFASFSRKMFEICFTSFLRIALCFLGLLLGEETGDYGRGSLYRVVG